jgi:hypothetical protein
LNRLPARAEEDSFFNYQQVGGNSWVQSRSCKE